MTETNESCVRKKAVVTGANRGIGREIFEILAKNFFDVALCVRQAPVELTELIAELNEKGAEHQIIELDLSDDSSIGAAAKAIHSWSKRIDVLVNNAGIAEGSLFSMTRIPDLKRVFQINYFSQLQFTQLISKKMIRRKSGSIINIASTSGLLGDRGTLAYGGSKAALIHSTKVLANELGDFGIRVNAIAPSLTETDMASQMDENAVDSLLSRSALKQIIQKKDVAELALFLASDNSCKITGQVIRLDGGLCL
jgi:3-oxoacyl-[acyl-carrier protein] reductase